MKLLLAILVIPACFAQRYTAPGGVVYTSPGGFGNVAYPGTGAAPRATFGPLPGQTLAPRSGVNTYRRPQGYAYAYPVYVGGGGYYGEPQAQAPVNVTVVNAPPQAPTVIINQNFGPQSAPDPGSTETTRIYQTPRPSFDETANAAPQPHYFLIAYKDHSVYSALAYWVEDKTMHYVTPQQTHNQASLDLIDLDFTKKLNQR